MSQYFSRKIYTLLVLSAFGVAHLALPAYSYGQSDDKKKDAKASSTKSSSKSKSSKKNAEKSANTTAASDSKAKPSGTPKPLSTKEDPAQIGKRKINSGSDKFFGWLGGSQNKEIALGRQLAMEIDQQVKLVEDPIITEYINRVGQNLVLHSDAKVPFTIKVIDSDEVNAFALPGGFFYVNKGLILAADNETELAGVMAHEIAHVAARHAMENNGKGQLITYGTFAGIIFGGPIAATVLQNEGGLLGGLAMLKFSRGAEEEADRLGVQYLYAAGYDPVGMSTMFEKLASQNQKKKGSVAKLFSSHPQSLDRRDSSLELVARFPEKEEYVISSSEFQRVKAHLMRMTNAKSGVLSDLDEQDPGKPTLKRRDPVQGESQDGASSSSSSDSGPPKLKRRDEPAPDPTPQPTPNN